MLSCWHCTFIFPLRLIVPLRNRESTARQPDFMFKIRNPGGKISTETHNISASDCVEISKLNVKVFVSAFAGKKQPQPCKYIFKRSRKDLFTE